MIRMHGTLSSIPLHLYLSSYAMSLNCRDSLAAQLEITLTKADSEQLARSIAEEQYSDLEKEKIMKELEIKEMMARHKQELTEKDATIASVSKILGFIIELLCHKTSDIWELSVINLKYGYIYYQVLTV